MRSRARSLAPQDHSRCSFAKALALVCNIDQHGRRVRYRIGYVLGALGVLVGGVGSRVTDGWAPWIAGGVLLAGGLFALFEANRGWCAARALGIKTRV